MIGVQDFCGHYDWTFRYIEETYGPEALEKYWSEAIAFDSQSHAHKLISEKGFDGMAEYWGHTLDMEEAGYAITRTEDAFRIDMHDCPSKGFLIKNGLAAHSDYCSHCMGWIGPVVRKSGFTIDHEHNHLGKCWWVLYKQGSKVDRKALEMQVGGKNVEHQPDWPEGVHHVYESCRIINPAEGEEK